MKKFPGTILSVLGVAVIAILAFRLFAQIEQPEYCFTEPIVVGDPDKFAVCLNKHEIDPTHYKIRIKRHDHDPPDQDAVSGGLKECSSPNWGGAQITQHFKLNVKEMAIFLECLARSRSPSANPSPTPAP
jgi:hypothetical protein